MSEIQILLQKRLENTLSAEEYERLENLVGNLTREELFSVLKEGKNDGLRSYAWKELSARGDWPVHWMSKVGLIIAGFGLIFSAIAAWPVIREWIPRHPKSFGSIPPVVSSPQSLAPPAKPPQNPAPKLPNAPTAVP